MHSDRAFRVVAGLDKVFFGTAADNKVYALDAATGQVRWTLFTEGAVRFAPVLAGDRLYFGADDGFVYCLGAGKGEVIWKHRPAPSGERVIGNGRLVSLWPVQTGLVVEDGVVYLAAGVFPYEGLYVCALDAETGSELWRNDTAGDLAWGLEYGGMSPQGYLVASEDRLYVPSGRAMPAAFDRGTGRFLRFLTAGGKVGGSWAQVDQDKLVAGVNSEGQPAKISYDDESGKRLGDLFAGFPAQDLVLTPATAFLVLETGLSAIDRKSYEVAAAEEAKTAKQRKEWNDEITKLRSQCDAWTAEVKALEEKAEPSSVETLADLRQRVVVASAQVAELSASLTAVAKRQKVLNDARVLWNHPRKGLSVAALAGQILVVGGEGVVLTVDAADGKLLSETKVEGTVLDLALAGGRVWAATDQGPIHCLGAARDAVPATILEETRADPYPEGARARLYEEAARLILKESGVKKGFCLVLQAGEGRLAWELARQSDLKVVGLESDPEQRRSARERLDATGWYGTRIVVEPWDLADLPDYFANLIVSDELITRGRISGAAGNWHRVLRPAGGVALFGHPAGSEVSPGFDLRAWLGRPEGMDPVRLARDGTWWKVTRGKLAGAADWTDLYGSSANTGSAPDELVRSPLGVLWYGEPGSEHLVDRHARTVSPLAVNGRLFVQGEERVQAYDNYNGTLLWERQIPGAVRVRVDVDGSNLSATGDALFVATHDKAYRLDAQTGETLTDYAMPSSADGDPRRWGYIAATERIVFGTSALPLRRDYGFLWNSLVENGRWKTKEELEPRLREALYAITTGTNKRPLVDVVQENHPVPDRKAFDFFKRSGIHWYLMNAFPDWAPDQRPSPVDETMMVSDAVVAFDTKTGALLWRHEGGAIPNITVTMAEGKLFFVQGEVPEPERGQALREREDWIQRGLYEPHDEGKLPEAKRDVRRVVALDAQTGKPLWSRVVDLSGCGGNKLGTACQDGKLLLFGHYSNHDESMFNKGSLAWRRITVLDAATGSCVWSKPLNYRRRPLITGQTIYIEPRACDLATGEIKMRSHPITGQPVPWEFLRPGHSCGIVTASPHSIFYRSYCAAIVDVERDSGLQLFGGVRPGCWNNLVPGNGLLNFQEASAGCTCSYPIRSTVVLKHKKEKEPGEWSVFIGSGDLVPVSHLALNLGAPGDMRDTNGTLWFAYPRPETTVGQGAFRNYGVKFDLQEQVLEGMGILRRDFRGVQIEGDTRSWLFTSALLGLVRCRIPVLNGEETGLYTVRLGFVAPEGDEVGRRVFDVRLQGRSVLTGFDPRREAGRPNKAVVKEFSGIEVKDHLEVELIPPRPDPARAEAPILHFLEVLRQ